MKNNNGLDIESQSNVKLIASKNSNDAIIVRYNQLLKIPCELMTLEQMREFDDLVDVMKQIEKGKRK